MSTEQRPECTLTHAEWAAIYGEAEKSGEQPDDVARRYLKSKDPECEPFALNHPSDTPMATGDWASLADELVTELVLLANDHKASGGTVSPRVAVLLERWSELQASGAVLDAIGADRT